MGGVNCSLEFVFISGKSNNKSVSHIIYLSIIYLRYYEYKVYNELSLKSMAAK